MKVLVVGATGQIGRLLAPAFSGHDVRGAGRADFDIRDREGVRKAVAGFKPDAVVLAAALVNADYCEDHPSEAYAVNVDGARNVAEASRGCRFMFFSTDHIFDGKTGPYSEEDKPDPLNVYGRTKLEAERVVQAVHARALIVRTTLVFSAAPGAKNFLMMLLASQDTVPCWTDHTATYTYGPNLAEATAELVTAGTTGIWNWAGTDVLNRHEFALKAARRFRLDPARLKPVSIREAPPRAPRALRAGLRTDKARAQLRTKLLSTDEALELAYSAYGRP